MQVHFCHINYSLSILSTITLNSNICSYVFAEINKKDDSSDDEVLSKKEFERFIIKKLKRLKKSTESSEADLSNVAVEVQDTKNYVVQEQRRSTDLANIVTYEELCTVSPFELPMKDMKLFLDFDQALVDPKGPELKANVVEYLDSYICTVGKKDSNVRVILRKFISKNVAWRVTAKKPMPDKTVLDSTEFGEILRDRSVKCSFNASMKDTIDEDEFLTTMGRVLSNVEDWEKGCKSCEVAMDKEE
ncbi:hypothetical protein QAD02_003675 [Eretmocerus hayati]|uniref:Uncharacterized protein n=1 Tax=Eretmocerus hayati TaxID=131215 RepID=A0ACC2NP73_9HYME|nr:hypothetical protein QAD02_003675 [Eretmocerus hayati]